MMTSNNGASELDKIVYISNELCRLKLTPKEFIAGFLTKEHPQLVYRRRTWATKFGWTSTVNLVQSIRNLFLMTQEGSDQWAEYIEGEAIRISRSQSPPIGYYPCGSFQSAVSVTPGFFTDLAMDQRKDRLTNNDTPFLYNILVGTLARAGAEVFTPEELDADHPQDPCPSPTTSPDDTSDTHLSSDECDELAYKGSVFSTATPGKQDRQARSAQTAAVICSMMAFARNRRQNGLQLANSICFVACGVSETINEYLHYIGLTSSRKTALVALQSLSRAAANNIVNSMSVMNRLAPSLCIDNLDMEQRVHLASVGTQNRMFHGTWGYIHVHSKSLLDSLDPDKLTLAEYHMSLRPLADWVIDPNLFLPTDSTNDYADVWKSQIATVMLKYVATPTDRKAMISTDPPTVEQVSWEVPDIHMLRLMDESDNSAEGIGQVMEALQRQSGLEPEEFFGRLQLINGDLGTAQLFNAIRSLRNPSEHCEHHLNNVTFSLGASHTLWNISQAILTKHFGNSSKMDDLGVWQYLDSLGIPPEKVIQKKDFSKMITALTHVHEATIQHCLRVVMDIHDKPISEVLPELPSERWNSIVEQCYVQYCSPQARQAASTRVCQKLSTLLIRLQDFSTVVEANRSMKAGDVGRLINIWKMWSIMTQSLPGLTHYSAYLPRLVLMLTKILPNDLAKLMRHDLLVSPSGRPNHFVAKDFLLENHNYWLKFFYVRAGIGTQIDRLRRLFSSNIPLLRTMFRSLRRDSGGRYVQQTHKHILNLRSLERFTQMAQDNDILDDLPLKSPLSIPIMPDTYLDGIQCLKKEIRGKPSELGRFLLHLPLFLDQDNIEISDDEEDMIIDGIRADTPTPNGYSSPEESDEDEDQANEDDEQVNDDSQSEDEEMSM
ncbi:hypothetical protein PGT21_029101 [Puccinia graminis f. sp. tritici]|uniref:DUF6589 domain-containing protein n=1 Tax=Puccinia graminis f. sp. tritici TaxID=56615 RepID=A0A5B0QP39_PUCGR|nr:hypothetical protein PGT21_029101 [Puccinia graminis f. sp. tritici]